MTRDMGCSLVNMKVESNICLTNDTDSYTSSHALGVFPAFLLPAAIPPPPQWVLPPNDFLQLSQVQNGARTVRNHGGPPTLWPRLLHLWG